MGHSNYAAALFGAAAAWAQNGMNTQLAFGEMAVNALGLATKVWNGTKYELPKGISIKMIPSGFQSWMSEGALKNMLTNEWQSLVNLRAYEREKIASDQKWANEGANVSASENAHKEELHLICNVWDEFSCKGQNRWGWAGNDTESQIKSVYAHLMNGLMTGSIQSTVSRLSHSTFDTTADLKPSYTVQHVKGSATISCLTEHVISVLKEHRGDPSQTTSADVMCAQQELGRAQIWEEQQTGCANTGVRAAQGYVSTEADTMAYGLMLAQQLAGALKLSIQELRNK